ncbi:MAG: hypothetical protein ACJ8CR_25020 [Roseiflexaceae bacterium]
MAPSKTNQVRDLIRRDAKPAAPATPAQVVERAPLVTDAPRGAPYALSTNVPIEDLPAEAQALGAQLYDVARRYVGARRRSGEALLDAVRCLDEARALADEGTWYLFLQVTKTSADVAERLLNIYIATQRDPRFEAAVVRGFLNQTVAGELARPSTPPEVVARLLEAEQPPRVADVKRAMRELKQTREGSHIVDNPHNAGSAGDPTMIETPAATRPTWLISLCERLAETGDACEWAIEKAPTLDEPATQMLREAVERLRRQLERVTAALE